MAGFAWRDIADLATSRLARERMYFAATRIMLLALVILMATRYHKKAAEICLSTPPAA